MNNFRENSASTGAGGAVRICDATPEPVDGYVVLAWRSVCFSGHNEFHFTPSAVVGDGLEIAWW